MPGSISRFDDEIGRYLRHAFPDKGVEILDVGAGSGKYASILSDYPNKDAVEIFEPYVERFALRKRYRKVYCRDLGMGDIRVWRPEALAPYGLVVLGDVLEHVTQDEAEEVLSRLESAGCAVLVAVPYLYPQGELDGNEHERHEQDDLTPEVMRKRYPGLERILGDSSYGLYGNAALMARLRGSQGESVQPSDRVHVNPSDFSDVRLAICTPNPGTVTLKYHCSMLHTIRTLDQFRTPFQLFYRSGASIDRVRNLLVKDALDASFGATHVLWVDSDQGWEPEHVYRLLWHRKPVVGVASIKKVGTPEFAVVLEDFQRVQYERGLLDVQGVGTGFLLVERSVFEGLFQAHPELRIQDEGSSQSKNHYALFQTALDERNHLVGEDLTFCRRYRDAGGRIYVDPHVDLVHVGTKEFRGSLATHMMSAD